MRTDPRLERIDAASLRVKSPGSVGALVFANADVPLESDAISELVDMLELEQTVQRFAEHFPRSFQLAPKIEQVAVTPDFHKGRGIPIGTVMATTGFLVPQAIGNDINCGMRLQVTSLEAGDVLSRRDELETVFRHLFFEGGRNIAMTRIQREAMLKEGLTGLFNSTSSAQTDGLWGSFHRLRPDWELAHVERGGSLQAGRIFGLDSFLGPDGPTRDRQIGSIGGGNHFVEVQRVERILDGTTAHAWGLKAGGVTIMIHTGSVAVGHVSGTYYRDEVRKIFPRGIKHPRNEIYILPDGEEHRAVVSLFWDALHNAANFAFANRLFLGLMVMEGLRQVCGELEAPLLYDAPHNLLWREKAHDHEVIVHRKGACPARGMEQMVGTPFQYFGEPVLVPGSMGASSFVMAGLGNPASLSSASHGAGRRLSRGEAMHEGEDEFRHFLENFRVVTPVDFRRPDVSIRRDIVEQKLKELGQEAPFAYKGIGPVIRTHIQAGLARPVAELTPLMTVKG